MTKLGILADLGIEAGGLEHPPLEAGLVVRLTRQISRNACILNRTWGYDSRGIWVSNGCRGEFLVGR